MEHYNASLRGPFYKQLAGKIGNIPCDSIIMHDRQRPIDKNKVAELKKDIEKLGLLQPIGVRYSRQDEQSGYRLIFGAHRYKAWLEHFETALANNDDEGKRRWHVIPAIIYSCDRNMSDDMALLLELTENVKRNPLSISEHKRRASQIGELWLKLEKPKKPKSARCTFSPPSQKEAITLSGVSPRTYKKWWAEYKASTGQPGLNWTSQSEDQYKAWLKYLDEQPPPETVKVETVREKPRDNAEAAFNEAKSGKVEDAEYREIQSETEAQALPVEYSKADTEPAKIIKPKVVSVPKDEIEREQLLQASKDLKRERAKLERERDNFKLERKEFKQNMKAEIGSRVTEAINSILPEYQRRHDLYVEYVDAYKYGPLTEKEYKKILGFFHSDRHMDADDKKKADDIFKLLKRKEQLLCKRKESENTGKPLPRSVDEMEAERKVKH